MRCDGDCTDFQTSYSNARVYKLWEGKFLLRAKTALTPPQPASTHHKRAPTKVSGHHAHPATVCGLWTTCHATTAPGTPSPSPPRPHQASTCCVMSSLPSSPPLISTVLQRHRSEVHNTTLPVSSSTSSTTAATSSTQLRHLSEASTAPKTPSSTSTRLAQTASSHSIFQVLPSSIPLLESVPRAALTAITVARLSARRTKRDVTAGRAMLSHI